MAVKPADSSASPGPAGEPAATPAAGATPHGPQEHYGPVALVRHTKDDGRALILYTRAEQPPA